MQTGFVSKIINIGQCLLKLFENLVDVLFCEAQCKIVQHTHFLIADCIDSKVLQSDMSVYLSVHLFILWVLNQLNFYLSLCIFMTQVWAMTTLLGIEALNVMVMG